MLAGSEGIGKIFFDDHEIANTIGMFAPVYILFSGGLDTNLTEIKPVIFDGMILSNFSVFITALILGAVVHFYFHFSLLESFLLGAIVSSTDEEPLRGNIPWNFNIFFFIVLISLSLQGSTINLLANILSLTKSQKKASLYPFAYENNIASQTKLLEFIVPYS
jgi:NhaP-type Na+/H+ and K+/H+ antiporter